MFLKKRNISSKIKRSKVTDDAALNGETLCTHLMITTIVSATNFSNWAAKALVEQYDIMLRKKEIYTCFG